MCGLKKKKVKAASPPVSAHQVSSRRTLGTRLTCRREKNKAMVASDDEGKKVSLKKKKHPDLGAVIVVEKRKPHEESLSRKIKDLKMNLTGEPIL